ncbi:hypothetical protein K5549_005319 [Capra hircus]|nr:hypothetical protein K5549_005319 [Capra hircus]
MFPWGALPGLLRRWEEGARPATRGLLLAALLTPPPSLPAGKGLAPAPGPRRPSFEAPGEPFPPFTQVAGPAFEGPAALEEAPRPYPDFLFAGVGPPCRPHPPKGYTAAGEAARTSLAGPGGAHYRAPLLVPAEPLGYGVKRSSSFQSKATPEAGAYAGLTAKGAAAPVPTPGLPFPAPGAAYAPAPHPKPPHQGHPGPPGRRVRRRRRPAGPGRPARTGLGAERFEPGAPPWPSASLARRDSLPKPGPSRTGSFSGAAAPPNAVTAVTAARILHPARAEPLDVDGLCAGLQQGLRGGRASEPPDGSPTSPRATKADRVGRDRKQIQTSPVPVRRGSRDEDRRESRIKSYSPSAFKFFMEQHVENVLKTHQQKVARRLQLEQEMAKVGAGHAWCRGPSGRSPPPHRVPVPARGGEDCADVPPVNEHVACYGVSFPGSKSIKALQLAGLCEAEQEQMRKILYQKESNYNRLKRAKMDKSMFVKVKTLGVGAFGEVCLACKVDTHALYAMKTLRKKDVLNRNQVAHVKAERDILAEADNEWVVKLYYSFQDKDSLYFVMDYIPGGDMMSLLIRMEVFPEHLARFYIAELTLAVESVHRMGFIHRDIKPDNILIDLDGHIKLTDFGLCTGFRWTHNSKYYQKGSHSRQDSMEPSDLWDDVSNCRCGDRLKTLEQRARRQHQRCLAHSLVGTPNYIAPEVLLRKGGRPGVTREPVTPARQLFPACAVGRFLGDQSHALSASEAAARLWPEPRCLSGYTQLCDWWSVGVILFEMLVGQPPFLAPTPTETQLKVELSPEARDLIAKLCCAAEHRLGRNGADDLKAHPFLGAIDFSSDIRRQPAPYVPTISHPMDTSNFDPVDEEGPWQDGSEDSSKAWDALGPAGSRHPEHAFYEFTFRRFFDDNGHPFRCPKPAVAEPVTEAEQLASVGPALGAQAGGCQPVYV